LTIPTAASCGVFNSKEDATKREPIEENNLGNKQSDEIITTEDEYEGYYIVKTIIRDIIDAKRVNIRDVKSYCNVLLDDNNRKPICRLYFNSSQKYIGLIDGQKNEERMPIDDLDEIYEYADRLKSTVKSYDVNEAASESNGVRGTYIDHFELNGVKYEVDSWKSMLLKICGLMLTAHKGQFDNVLSLGGRKRAYFSKNPTELRSPEPITGTDIYVETSHSADRIVKLSRDIISLFGYSEDDISINTK